MCIRFFILAISSLVIFSCQSSPVNDIQQSLQLEQTYQVFAEVKGMSCPF